MIILGYIVFGIAILLFCWCLHVWWNFCEWIGIAIPVSIILLLIYAALK